MMKLRCLLCAVYLYLTDASISDTHVKSRYTWQNADINIATKCWSVGSVSAFCNVYQHLTWVYF